MKRYVAGALLSMMMVSGVSGMQERRNGQPVEFKTLCQRIASPYYLGPWCSTSYKAQQRNVRVNMAIANLAILYAIYRAGAWAFGSKEKTAKTTLN